MAFIIINRADAAAIFAGDLIQAVNLMDQLYARLEKMSNKMAEMVTGEDHSQIETLYGLPAGAGDDVKGVVDTLKTALESGMADQFRSQLG